MANATVPDPSYAGRTYPPSEPVLVTAERIAEFAAAIGATSPLHTARREARRAGYRDVVAPPTFAVRLAQQTEQQYVADPEAGIDFSRVVHAEEKFVHHRPIMAGDELTATLRVDSVKSVGGNAMITTTVRMTDDSDNPVSDVTSSLIVRAAEEGEAA